MTEGNGIILIEDNQDDCEVITRGFKACDFSYPIQWFKTSSSALEYLQNPDNPLPYLIILDLNLPGIDGRTMLESIKLNERLKEIPVIIFTTSSDQKDVKQCYEKGANSYIQKPVNFYQMKEVCKTISQYWFNISILPNYDMVS